MLCGPHVGRGLDLAQAFLLEQTVNFSAFLFYSRLALSS